MPYTLPTSDQFYTRFPIFEDVDPATITALILEASNQVDNTWIENDYQPAIMYLAAHLWATDNSGEGDDVEIGDLGSNVVASESFGGGLSVSYRQGAAGSGIAMSDMYGTTVYGRRFLQMAMRNKPGVVAI